VALRHVTLNFPTVRTLRTERIFTMPKVTPRKIEEKIDRTLNAWEQIAPTKSFGAMTLLQFQQVIAPSKETRERIEDLEDQLTQAITQRETADDISLDKIQLVVNGVLADPTEGPDSALYEALGYTRKSDRKSGLTTKKKKTGDDEGKP
jgi:hypothetical protein